MIKAYSLQTQVLIELPGSAACRLERRDGCGGAWLVLTDSGFVPDGGGVVPLPVTGNYLDKALFDGICQYRARNFSDETSAWDYTAWLRCGTADPIGITFGNYQAPQGLWGDIITSDDLRNTYLWGVDFRASNGASFTDAQIQFFIDAALAETERELNITVRKTRIVCEPQRRGLEKDRDYDESEPYYTYKRERVERNGMITTRKRPIISISRLDLLNRNEKIIPLLQESTFDPTKGQIKFFNRLPRQSDSMRSIEAAIYPYGPGTLERNLFYAVDYIAGFETSDDVPMDLREIIGKRAAVSLLNIIGRGLMSGFSSSSLSMDGVSESFSSTQSATSAYYGADVKEYKDDIEKYIAENKMKFGHITMGAL
ncbi:MAG: hypothetical protein LBK05_00175 [Treponema sp.]|jgi:hypothetical protein|nr:hypothetical protein [Treponema sp.]